ncbi:hypothetical protein EON83_19530 [bacterium]|nr:MAG: hypothetical protein EON83_19530 [bacterium]
MSSVYFQFYYDDGSIRPFDADVASSTNPVQLEAPAVMTYGLFDIFELTPEELGDAGLVGPAFLPAFIVQYAEIAEADGEPLEGLGIEPNIYWDSATIPVEPSQLKVWAHGWLESLQRMNDSQRKEVLPFHWKTIDEVFKSLGELMNQAECARNNNVGMMLFIAW